MYILLPICGNVNRFDFKDILRLSEKLDS
jgi:hypothetical protein